MGWAAWCTPRIPRFRGWEWTWWKSIRTSTPMCRRWSSWHFEDSLCTTLFSCPT
jgi:hypothetical protein